MKKTNNRSENNDKKLLKANCNNPRYDFIDACKGFGILLMVLGHVYDTPDEVNLIIYSFHMPLFFILSGFVFNKPAYSKSFGLFLGRKAKSLLIPYIVYALLNLVLNSLWKLFWLHEPLTFEYYSRNIRGILFCYSNLENMPNCSPIWFLLALFISSLILYWLVKIDWKINTIILVLFVIICSMLTSVYEDMTVFPWKFPVFLMGTVFLYVGYLIRRAFDYGLFRKNVPLTIISVAILLLSIVVEIVTKNKVSMNNDQYGNVIVFLFVSISISAVVVYWFWRCKKLSNTFLVWLGKNTLYFIGLNYFFRSIAIEVHYYIPGIKAFKPFWIEQFIMTAVPIMLCAVICNRIKRRKIYRKRLGSN